MKWKIFITACISTAIVFFPQNIIGCGGGEDPYDYYTSFFHPNLPTTPAYRPFYYTGYNFLYEENEPIEVTDILSTEWAAYCGKPVLDTDVKEFMHQFSSIDINSLCYKIEKNITAKIPDSVLSNGMTNYFLTSKDLEGLGYILYAKSVEPYSIGNSNHWQQTLPADSATITKLIKDGQQLYTAAKKDFFKLKYAYQILRLAAYNYRNEEAIKFYDTYIAGNKTNSVLQSLSLSLKAYALKNSGKKMQAAYFYSKAFNSSTARRVSNYISFRWMLNKEEDRKNYLALCKNDKEKAAMLSLFSLATPANDLASLKKIYSLDAGSDALEVLIVREINKLEQNFFTPSLRKEKGGKTFYYSWSDHSQDSLLTTFENEARELAAFLHDAAKNNLVKNAGLFEAGACHAAYITKDFISAKKYFSAAEKMVLTEKVKSQLMLTKLLITISEQDKIDTAFEENLLPSLQWLEEKAKKDTVENKEGGYNVIEWKVFYRNLMSEILAQKYHQQGDYVKEALAVGAADWMTTDGGNYEWGIGISFLRENLMSKDVKKLFDLFTNKNPSKLERYLLTHNAIKKADVIDFAGTAYLRDYDYANAISWFKKSTDKKSLPITNNPFVDLLYDQEEPIASDEKFIITKIAFAQEMQKQMLLSVTDKGNAAKHFYKIANGLYNITYYGHAWQLVQYNRSGSDGYRIPADATPFQKEYYGCYAALEYFKKAMDASTDKNFKARCLFMMAKCSQKQVQNPSYYAYSNDWDKFNKDEKAYWPAFKNNKYFEQFIKEYGKTNFYTEAFNSCSYLRDFVISKN